MSDNIKIAIRKLKPGDLDSYLYWNHPSREFHKYNGPYYEKKSVQEIEEIVSGWRIRMIEGEEDVLKNKKMIVDAISNELIGQVNWYWKSKETNWMEVGIVIFNENYWGKGIGFDVLRMWINQIFSERAEFVRIGLTTWSGNERMMRLSEKLGMKKEAVYRKARIVNGKYYDSVSYGILREEWDTINRD
ncbi:Protein N-acetyltransferase, RimJ/RimL family [Peptoclostridium litorale DSM 5388]|uniref:Putative HD superfamily hydrolase n=1 Tax=Peptoclostridium litorale DSM 5388 TaxID=1121324 RepID=A0A069RLR8_PEPLI|nr:GNAT family protein [Peptoclostridium litorale]KDR95112.1 putative HD superfamily hydrolase [Peptoclostridium litorale DSM 5388]SIN74825.1 Protein N-acetyltransferase, RimJ/RimL family [Peptoclostridium litorale DSM 5388]